MRTQKYSPFDFFLFTYIFTACCATSLCMATERLVNGEDPKILNPLHLLVFGSTLLVYNLPIIINGKGNERFYSNRGILFFVGTIITMASFFLLPQRIIIAAMLLGVFSFAYSLPILPLKGKRRLRDFGWLKTLDLAGVWTIATSVMPILYWQKHVANYPFEVLIRFVFIFALCILFDLRDIQLDTQHNRETLPSKMGLKNSYRMIDISMVVFLLLGAFQFMRFHTLGRFLGMVATAAIFRYIVRHLQKKPTDRAYIWMGDGIMLFYAVLVLL